MPSFRRRASVIDADRVDEPPQEPDRPADAAEALALAEEAEAEAAEAEAIAAAARARARAIRLRRQARPPAATPPHEVQADGRPPPRLRPPDDAEVDDRSDDVEAERRGDPTSTPEPTSKHSETSPRKPADDEPVRRATPLGSLLS